MDQLFTRIASAIATLAGKPLAFTAALLVILIWGVSGPIFQWSDTWQLVVNTGTTIVTFLMVFLIQNSQNRDAAAMQAKLDELIRAVEAARSQFIGIEHLTEEQIEAIRDKLERDVSEATGRHGSAEKSIERLLGRY
ncbi:MAG TPA: low affinity iron permease family protein [Croceibacterium sp.]|nr:low affinity iron permease family protein [Croceibacterium sp.]